MIVNDQTTATLVAASALAFGLFTASAGAASAADLSTASVNSSAIGAAPAAPDAASDAISVTFVYDGGESTVITRSRTFAAFLEERGLRATPADYVSQPLDSPLTEGSRLVYRTAVDVKLYVGRRARKVQTAAPTVADFLTEQQVVLGPGDEVVPAPSAPLDRATTVRVTRIDRWTADERDGIAPSVVRRSDPTLDALASRVVDPGEPGERETTVRYERRDGRLTSTVLASRIVREPRPRVIAHGIAAYAALASVAEQGFAGALRLAGTALHMIATAYTKGCYGCSGITASGFRAGFGIIAVDPSVIPLGSRLFIPGYGRAIAGDTGGAIVGHRVDLGFNSNGEALRFGRRPVTVYLLR